MKELEVVTIEPPPKEQRVVRGAVPQSGAKRTRYDLPESLKSTSPVGYRTRVSLIEKQTSECLQLLTLERPTSFVDPDPVTDGELFEEAA